MEMTSLSPKMMTENNLFNTQSLPKNILPVTKKS